jgi:hypothetical protein
MMSILWALLWPIIRSLLGLSKEMVNVALELVAVAQDLKQEDGTDYTGDEKFNWVVAKLVEQFGNTEALKNIGKSTLNTLVELALAFIKSKSGA